MTMTSLIARDLAIAGLKNAHAMETQARELSARQSERLSEFPTLEAQIRQHLRETEMQLQRLEGCLEAAGQSASTLKDTALSALANLTAMAYAMAGDEILKNTFANYAFEHYEIAAYKSLLTLCDKAQMHSAATTLRQSLYEKERMAKWIEQHIEEVTLSFLGKEEQRSTAWAS
jgi:ferritin-like metal-binding protein YciE